MTPSFYRKIGWGALQQQAERLSAPRLLSVDDIAAFPLYPLCQAGALAPAR